MDQASLRAPRTARTAGPASCAGAQAITMQAAPMPPFTAARRGVAAQRGEERTSGTASGKITNRPQGKRLRPMRRQRQGWRSGPATGAAAGP